MAMDRLRILCEDTFFRGAFCGVAAGVVKNFLAFIFFFIIFTDEHYFWKFSSVLAYHGPPENLFMHITALIIELMFCAFLGVIFVLLVASIKTRHYLLMGTLYGSFIWFFVKCIVVIYKVDQLKPSTTIHPFIIWMLSMLFGLLIAILDKKLSPKTS